MRGQERPNSLNNCVTHHCHAAASSFGFQKGLAEVWDTIAETRAKTDIHEKVTIVDRRKNAGNLLYLVKFVSNDDESVEPFWQNRTDLNFMVGDLDAFDAARDKEEALTGATMQESWGKR